MADTARRIRVRQLLSILLERRTRKPVLKALASEFGCSTGAIWSDIHYVLGDNQLARYRDTHILASERGRIRRLGLADNVTFDDWKRICEQHDYCCAICHEKKPLTMDHIIPLVKGGQHDPSNIQPLCSKCNHKKGTH